MVGPHLFLRALAARSGPATVGVTLGLPLALSLSPAAVAATSDTVTAAEPVVARTAVHAASVPVEPDLAPLRVKISSMSKATLPRRGSIKLRGTVTNRSDVTWTTVKLYTFLGADLAPMTDPAALDAAMDVPYDDQVGERLVNVGEPGLIEVLEPGESASYVVKVPVDSFDFPDPEQPEPGVYWFGIHALGQGGALARDTIADGRARTFLPVVARDAKKVSTALVVPMVHRIRYDSDGSLANEERWAKVLAPSGRLHDLLTLGERAAEAGVPLTWLVDPALLDAVGQLADGNAPRSLGATAPGSPDELTEQPTTDPADPDDPASTGTTQASPGDGDGDTGSDSDTDDEPASAAVQAARDWLPQATPLLRRAEVLALPYGDVDIGAALRVDPALLDLARAQQSTVLADLGIRTRPVNAAPGGFVTAATAAAAPDGVPLLVSDRFVPTPTSGVAGLGGSELIVTSSGASQGSPGPGRPKTAVGLRQRLLSEAAVRTVPSPDPQASSITPPLVVVLPTDWKLSTAEEFFDGIAPDWVAFGTLDDAVGTRAVQQVSPDDLREVNDRREVDAETFAAAQELIDTGDTLQRVLVENTSLGARITEEALSGLSYSVRGNQQVARNALALSRDWLVARLGSVQITASSGVTLSGDSGTFVVTLINDLDEIVRVSITALTDPELTIDAVEPLELGPGSRTSVLLTATTTTSRVHNVTLLVTDARGAPLGASEQLPVRSVLVSDVIWVIIGVGVGTLFLAIGLRLRRRLLASRRRGAEAT